MSIQLNYTEDFSDGLKRLMIEQCEKALKYISTADSTQKKHEAVHETRKAFKKVRACLRLVRDSIDFYKEENKFFRDLARELSDVRDSVSNLETLELIVEQYDSHLYQNSFNNLKKDLEKYRDELAEKTFRQEHTLQKIEENLESKLKEIPGWKIEISGFEDLDSGIERTYKRGRKGKKKSAKSSKIENLHEWRKRAKYLRYQVDVINRIWPKMLEAYEDELHALTDYTGLHHDLYNLKKVIAEEHIEFPNGQEKTLFYSLVDKYQEYMVNHALLKGSRCYVNSPSEFCNHIESYWEAYNQEISLSELPRMKHLEV